MEQQDAAIRRAISELGKSKGRTVWFVLSDRRKLRFPNISTLETTLSGRNRKKIYGQIFSAPINSRYTEEKLPQARQVESVVWTMLSEFMNLLRKFGFMLPHFSGKKVSNTFSTYLNKSETVGSSGKTEKFRSILEPIRGAVYTTEIPQYENIHQTVSIGGVYQAHPLVEAIRRADKLMYWAKQKRNDVQT